MLRMCRKWHFRASNFKHFLGEYAPKPRGLQPFLSPSNILSQKGTFSKNAPLTRGKILKKVLSSISKKTIKCLFTY
jgi:hypothetical protein